MWRASFTKIAIAGYGATGLLIALLMVFSLLAFRELHDAAQAITEDRVKDLLEVAKLQDAAERSSSSCRGFLMTKGAAHLSDLQQARADLHESLGRLETLVEDMAGQDLLKTIRRYESDHRLALDPVLELRRFSEDVDRIARLYEERVVPTRRTLDATIDVLMAQQQQQFIQAADAYTHAAQRTMPALLGLAVVCLFSIVVIAFFCTRLMTREYELERVARHARDEILALVSHDLKNPLGAILMSAKLLERDSPPGETDDKTRHRAALIRRAADRMSALLNDLLDAASIEAGRFKIDAHPCPVGFLVAEAIEAAAPLAAAKSLSIDRELREPDTLVQIDRARLLQVFGNLLGNAIKFTPEGGRIMVRAWPDGPCVRFLVADSGPGIPKEQRERIFDRFWRSELRDGGGTGLGLYSVKGIIEAHGGNVWIDPDPSEGGTTVCFTVPRAEI